MPKLHQTYKYKYWWWNINNIVINYQHKGEDNHMRFIDMIYPKCQIDRIAPPPSVIKFSKVGPIPRAIVWM